MRVTVRLFCFGKDGCEIEGHIVDGKARRLIALAKRLDTMHSAIKQPECEQVAVLIGNDQPTAGKDGIFPLLFPAVGDHYPAQKSAWRLNFFGINNEPFKGVVEGLLFQFGGGAGLGDLIQHLLERRVTPGAHIERQEERPAQDNSDTDPYWQSDLIETQAATL